MNNNILLQDKISNIKIVSNESVIKTAPEDFIPWGVDLSPSALYGCSVVCRKNMGFKTPEIKWISVKRWVNVTSSGIVLPEGCYLSIKRREYFEALPEPKFKKQDYILLMFPHGNVWFYSDEENPITEEWMWSELDGKTMFEHLINKDLENPIIGYWKSCYEYLINNPDQIGIHLKRKKSTFGRSQ